MANKVYVGQEGAQELYRRVKALIPAVDQELDENSSNPISNSAVTNAFKKFGGFKKSNGTGADNHPAEQNPDPKVIYLVEDPNSPDPDHFYEWIWEVPAEGDPIWHCIGTATMDLEDYYTKDEVDALLDEKLDIDDYHEYSAGNGLSLNNYEFKVTPDNADDGYFTTKSNQVVWIPDQFVTIVVPDPVVPTRSLRIQFDDPTFDASTYEWPTATASYQAKLRDATWTDLGNGVWDMTYDFADWTELFGGVKESFGVPTFNVIGGDCTGVTKLNECFYQCDRVRNFSGLTNADLVTSVSDMFMGAVNIESIEMPDMAELTWIARFACGSTLTKLDSIKFGNLPKCRQLLFVAQYTPNITSIELGNLPSLTNVDQFNLYVPALTNYGSSNPKFSPPTLKYIKLGDMVGLTDAYGMFYASRAYDTSSSKTKYGGVYDNVETMVLGDMPNLTSAQSMFSFCKSLKSMPDFITGNLTNVSSMWAECHLIEGGILNMYNKLSSMSSITEHHYTFQNCGRDSTTGAVELAQIPSNWTGK